MTTNIQKFLEELKLLNLPIGEYVIVSSGPMAMRGIRECGDLDLLITEKLFNDLSKKYTADKAENFSKVVISENIHKVYTRDGDNLRMKLNLDFTQLVLGDKVELKTIDGSKIRVTIPKFSDVGNILRVNGKGMKTFKSSSVGDLFIVLGINIPKSLTKEEEELILKLKK